MTRIESEKLNINCSDKNLFEFLSSFHNFAKFMPEQVTNWNSTPDTCRFTISGLADLEMKMVEKNEFSRIFISAGEKKPFNFELICLIEENGQDSSSIQLVFDADLNPMLKMMAQKPLQNFVNMLVQKMQKIFA